jgi:Uma2 family endonuclease
MTTIAAFEPAGLVIPPVAAGDGEHYEIINGQRVELPPMSAYASRLATRLASKINYFAEVHDLGEAAIETLFDLGLPQGRKRRPDVGFVSYQRWSKGKPSRVDDNAWVVIPNLTVEVVSPTDFAQDLLTRIGEYFDTGVQLVWVVYPLHRIVYVYESLTSIRGLARTDVLDGGVVLPGFRLPLTELFKEETAAD